MSLFREALRAMLMKDLYCRKCKAMNVPQASPTILVDQTGSRAHCEQCDHDGLIEDFQPPTSKEK